jgi:DNA-binding beta-propeller fold protein YncE
MKKELVLLALAACGGEASIADVDAGGDGSAPPPNAMPAPELGSGDHSPASVELVVELEGSDLHRPTGLAFDPLSGRLWIVNHEDNSWTVLDDVEHDASAPRRFFEMQGHFLDHPSSISFHGSEAALATCQESINHGDHFMGPTAWTSDISRFDGDFASHYDMLHESGNCVGIAWSEGHVWWAFNGARGSLDRNDFHGWHPDAPDGLGGEDHKDGEIFRYADGELARVAGVPSGMAHDGATQTLYVADTGHGRIVRIDTRPRSGTEIASLNEEVPLYRVDGVQLEEVVAPGTLDQPSGMILYKGLLYVADHGTGVITAFSSKGEKLNWLDTGLGAGHLAGLAISPAGKLHFLDLAANRLYRVDPK